MRLFLRLRVRWATSEWLDGFAFQACAIDHSAISPFRIDDLQSRASPELAIVIRPSMCRDHLRALLSIALAVKTRGVSSLLTPRFKSGVDERTSAL
jgi:hypothetical protein